MRRRKLKTYPSQFKELKRNQVLSSFLQLVRHSLLGGFFFIAAISFASLPQPHEQNLSLQSIETVIEYLSQKNDGVALFWNKNYRDNAIHVLISLGSNAQPELKKQLRNKNNIHRNTAALALSRIAPSLVNTQILPILLRDLKKRSVSTQREAVLTLGDMGPCAKNALPALIQCSRRAKKVIGSKKNHPIEGYEFLRAEIAEAIGKINTPSKEIIHVLVDELRPTPAFPNSDVYAYAGGTLALWKKQAVSELIQALRDPDIQFRTRASVVLGKIGPDARSAVLALQHLIFFDKSITDPANKDFRKEIVKALLLISPESKDKVFANFVMTADVDSAARDLGTSELASYLISLQDENKLVRKKTALILGKINPPPKNALSGLAWALFDPESEVGKEAAIALGRMGPVANEAAPYLVDSFSSKNADLRLAAAEALGKIGRLNTDVLIGMLMATKDKDKRVRKTLKECLTKIGINQPDDLNKAIAIIRG